MKEHTKQRIKELRDLFPSLNIVISLRENIDSQYNSMVAEIYNDKTMLGSVEYPFIKEEYSSPDSYKEKADAAIEACLDVIGVYDEESAKKIIEESKSKNTEQTAEKPSENLFVIYTEALTKDEVPSEDNKPTENVNQVIDIPSKEQEVEEKLDDIKSDDSSQETPSEVVSEVEVGTTKKQEADKSDDEVAVAEFNNKIIDESDIVVDVSKQPAYLSYPLPVRNAYTQVSKDVSNRGQTMGEIYEQKPAKIEWLINTRFSGKKLKQLEDDIAAAKIIHDYFAKAA